jgi:hypothetical protein
VLIMIPAHCRERVLIVPAAMTLLTRDRIRIWHRFAIGGGILVRQRIVVGNGFRRDLMVVKHLHVSAPAKRRGVQAAEKISL